MKSKKKKGSRVLICEKCGRTGAKFQCSKCKVVFYCSRKCQERHWGKHQRLCCKPPSILQTSRSNNLSNDPRELRRIGKELLGKGFFENYWVFLVRGDALSKMKQFGKAIEDFSKVISLKNIDESAKLMAYKNRGDAYCEIGQFPKAVNDFSKAIDLKPELNLFNNRGNAYAEMEEFSKAIEDFTKSLEICKTNPLIYNNRALAYNRLKDYRKSIEDHNKSIEMDDQNYNFFDGRGSSYYGLEEYAKAIDDFTAAIELEPNISRIYVVRGVCYNMLKKYSTAMNDFNKAIDIDPQDYKTSVYLHRGNSFSKMEDYAKALCDYNVEIDNNPDPSSVSRAYFNRGNTFFTKLKDYPKAVKDFSKAIGLNSSFHEAYISRGNVFSELKNYSKSLDDFSKAINLKPDDYRIYNNRGICYRDLKEYSNAINDFTKAIELNPSDSDAYNKRGIVYDDLNLCRKAVEDYTKAIELNPVDYFSLINRASTYHSLKEYPKAIEDTSRAIELNPNDTRAYVNRGSVYCATKEYKKSIEDFSKALEINDEDIASLLNRGDTYNELNMFEEALVDFSKASELDPLNHVCFIKLSKALFLNSEIEKALESASKAIELNPQSYKAYYLRGLIYKSIGEDEKSSLDNMTAEKKEKVNIRLYGHSEEKTKIGLVDEFGFNLIRLQKSLRNVRFQDLKIIKFLGGGCYGHTYLCHINNIEGEFVVKIYTGVFMSEERKLQLRERDSLYVQYHANLVTILGHNDNEDIHTTKLPDYEEYWGPKGKKGGINVLENSSFIIMKYYPGDLKHYLQKITKRELSSLQVCHFLQGIINGANYMHENMIVHRDLHPGNVLIDEKIDSCRICDFGCSLDLRQNHGKFKVHPNDECMYVLYTSSHASWKRGGASHFLPPEIRDAEEDDDAEYIDYEKCDLFSIGLIGEAFLEKTVKDEGFDKLDSFVKKFLREDPKERIDFREGVLGIRELIHLLQGIEYT